MCPFFQNQSKNFWFVCTPLHFSIIVKWPIYTSAHSSSYLSTLVYIHLMTCLHLSTFASICVTRLHSSTFVYISLHLSTLVYWLVCVFRTHNFFCILLLFSAPHSRLRCTDYKINARFYINTLQRNFQSWVARNLFLMLVSYDWFLSTLRLILWYWLLTFLGLS